MSWGSRGSAGVRVVLAIAAVAAALACAAPVAGAATFSWIQGYDEPATPDALDRVGVLKEGPADAKKVLVLVPGTSASAAYFAPLAQDILSKTKDWRCWSVERRENLFEDHSMVDRAKRGEATVQQVFDYYLNWLTNPAITDHFQLALGAPSFVRQWGMRVAVEDLRHVIEEHAPKAARSCSAAIRSAAPSRPRTRRGISTAGPEATISRASS